MKNFLLLSFLFLILFTAQKNAFAVDRSKIYFEAPAMPSADFTVSVLLDADKPVNAFDLEISYPNKQLQFLGSNNANSIVDVWQTKPTLTENGTIHLIGGISKSFQGERGLLIEIFFKVLNSGEAQFSFEKSGIYIADGLATRLEVASEPLSITLNGPGTININNKIIILTFLCLVVAFCIFRMYNGVVRL